MGDAHYPGIYRRDFNGSLGDNGAMKRELPKLHLRDLFWLVLVIGMGCGWCVHAVGLMGKLKDALWWKSRCESLQFAIEKEGMSVEWHSDWVGVEGMKDEHKGFGIGVTIDNPDEN